MFSTACDSASITSIVSKWWPSSSLQSRKKRKVGLVRDDSHVVFGQKFPGEKASARMCFVVMQQPVLLLPKFRAKSSYIFLHSL
jgi:hypothetical protein